MQQQSFLEYQYDPYNIISFYLFYYIFKLKIL
uniref:Uncharacterized protein n=1 Tax=Myoviridae sp. ctIty1 TaxID=2827673 RepID=A0A8S5TGZ2_9CAUD|nr:MAG TPA: hypothetical protein [Myoviridae sp. ctIty1]